MIISLILLVVGLIITGIVYRSDMVSVKNPNTWTNTYTNTHITLGVCSVVFIVIHLVVICESYWSYLDDRAFYSATSEQYHSAIKIYKDHAVIDMGEAAFTDLKYQGYQENISNFISSLRNKIIDYNQSIVKKRTMNKNPFFNWFIVKPDKDMLVMKMKIK